MVEKQIKKNLEHLLNTIVTTINQNSREPVSKDDFVISKVQYTDSETENIGWGIGSGVLSIAYIEQSDTYVIEFAIGTFPDNCIVLWEELNRKIYKLKTTTDTTKVEIGDSFFYIGSERHGTADYELWVENFLLNTIQQKTNKINELSFGGPVGIA